LASKITQPKPQSPRHGGKHLDGDQDAPGLRQPEPQPGHDVGQRSGQDDVGWRRGDVVTLNEIVHCCGG